MAVGFPTKANWAAGDVLTASALDDLAGTVNLVSAPLYNAAGKNKIINGDFGVWQRGTTFTAIPGGTYSADRWSFGEDGSGNVTVSQQTFTPGTAPVAGYEGTYFLRSAVTTTGTATYFEQAQKIEDVRVFAGQTVTMSFWAKADSARTSIVYLIQNFGTGGSAATVSSNAITYSTTWTRYTFTFALPSITGKTIGTNSSLTLGIRSVQATGSILDIWGVQVEAGSYATGFQTATGTVPGELEACQRYLPAITLSPGTSTFNGYAYTTNGGIFTIPYPVTPRVAPTGITVPAVTTNFTVRNSTNGDASATTLSLDQAGLYSATLLSNGTLIAGTPARLVCNSNLGYILFTGCEL